jgi:prefoldin subunit 5
MVDPKGTKLIPMVVGAGVNVKNTINVVMEDLTKEDHKKIEQELQEEMAEMRERKLVCVTLANPIFMPKPSTHRMYAQDQLFHTYG